MTVRDVATRLQVWQKIAAVIGHQTELLETVGEMSVRPSRALTRLGSYVSRGGQPVCIRLQFAQEPEQLQETLLHEVAHACDHMVNQPGVSYRNPHGEGWRRWMAAFGAAKVTARRSAGLTVLYRQRLKVVAICSRCGEKIHRLRRFSRRRRYRHVGCGGLLKLV